MARLKNVRSGAIVNVPDEKAERLGSEWEPIVDKTEKPAPKRTANKPDAKSGD